ncbi:hypothetical protein ABIB62_004435 [Mucilaginibacter sp. UYP25]|uniref:heme-binding domain-containing protein n=1 Tax=unclassified Mucilaginibacter TaxID=2617802 RepID=UPI00339529FF
MSKFFNIINRQGLKKVGFILLILFVALQFLRPEIRKQAVTGDIKAPDNVKAILRRACYDCHSNESKLGWADQIVPVYWQVARHINEGRARLNFSEWNKLTPAEQKTKLWESVNHVALGAMPRPDYKFIHPSAKISDADLLTLKNYLSTIIDYKPADTAKINAEDVQYKAWLSSDQKELIVPVSLNGIRYDPDYKNWQPLSSSERFENGTMRVIFGNAVAVQAMKENHMRPWPDGTRIAKALWTQISDDNGNTRTGAFVQLDMMIKNSRQYKSTEGWGFARFKTLKLIPYGKTSLFASECINCHRPMKENDFVFTIPVKY